MTHKITDIPEMPPRSHDAHKGQFGKVLILGGSRHMIGAPALAANAALRSGAGLVRIATGRSIQLTVAALAPCATSIPLPEDQKGLIGATAIHDILDALDDNDSLALGPGIGQSDDLQTLVNHIVNKCQKPMVIDADALNNLAKLNQNDLQFSDKTILTPHPGEMARLWKTWFREEPPTERSLQAEKLAQRSATIVVLKGAGTVITDGKSTYINQTGNPGMATGGSGDVLTGCIAALLANKQAALSPLSAAILGTYVHGRAGDLAAALLTETAMTATDLIDLLPDAWSSVQTESSHN
jgi:ADP-dependent NAD(P)H-hydrate dehydratase